MNKTFLKILGISLAVVFAVFLSACPGEPNNNNNNNNVKNFEIAGTYNFFYTDVSHIWVFNTDKTFKISWVRQSERNYTGTWSVSGNEITLKLDDVMGVSIPSETFTASKNENKVTLTLKGNSPASTTFAIFSMAATSLTLTEGEGSSGGTWTPDGYSPIQLTENQWTDGSVYYSSNYSSVQWFTFTATAFTQYIHVSFGKSTYQIKNMYVEIYDSNGEAVGNNTNMNSSTHSTSRSLTSGQKYYIKVWNSERSLLYQITFNTSSTPPTWTPDSYTSPIQLTENQWADAYFSSSSQQDWFTFTATSSTQYVHIHLNSLGILSMQVSDSYGGTTAINIGMRKSENGTNNYSSGSLTIGQKYYIKVCPEIVYTDGSMYISTGTYNIAFNTSSTPPANNGKW